MLVCEVGARRCHVVDPGRPQRPERAALMDRPVGDGESFALDRRTDVRVMDVDHHGVALPGLGADDIPGGQRDPKLSEAALAEGGARVVGVADAPRARCGLLAAVAVGGVGSVDYPDFAGVVGRSRLGCVGPAVMVICFSLCCNDF